MKFTRNYDKKKQTSKRVGGMSCQTAKGVDIWPQARCHFHVVLSLTNPLFQMLF